MSLIQDIRAIFPDAKPHEGYMRVRCPYHSNGHERHPSMSIITTPHNGLEPGFCQCFACGWKGTFAEIAADFGLEYVPDDKEVEISENPLPETNPVDLKVATLKKDTPFKFSPYLASRGIPEEIQKQYKVYEREDEHKVYMPVFNREGKFLYANARSTVGKRFFIPRNIHKDLAGIEEIDFTKPIGIVESQINMLSTAAASFVRSVATLGVANISALSVIRKAPGPFLLMLDGDEAGEKATEKIRKFLGEYKCLVFKFEPKEDVNDLWIKCNFNPELFAEEMEKRRVKE